MCHTAPAAGQGGTQVSLADFSTLPSLVAKDTGGKESKRSARSCRNHTKETPSTGSQAGGHHALAGRRSESSQQLGCFSHQTHPLCHKSTANCLGQQLKSPYPSNTLRSIPPQAVFHQFHRQDKPAAQIAPLLLLPLLFFHFTNISLKN